MKYKTDFFTKFRSIVWNIDNFNMYSKSLSTF